MVGDGHVLVAERLGRQQHRLERVAPVAPVGVHVQVAADLLVTEQPWQLAPGGGLHLARAFAQFRRHRRQIERGVQVVLGRRRASAALGDRSARRG